MSLITRQFTPTIMIDVSFEAASTSLDLAASLQSSVLLSESRNSLCQLQRREPG